MLGLCFKDLLIDFDVSCSYKLSLSKLLIVNSFATDKAIVLGLSQFVHTIYLQQNVDIGRCAIFLLLKNFSP